MKNYDELVEINHNPNWPYIPDNPFRVLIIDGSGSGKTNVLLNYLYIKDPLEPKYQLKLENSKAFVAQSQTTGAVYENLEDYNPAKKRNLLMVFDYTIAGMEANKKIKLRIKY